MSLRDNMFYSIYCIQNNESLIWSTAVMHCNYIVRVSSIETL